MPKELYCHTVALCIFCALYDVSCVAATMPRRQKDTVKGEVSAVFALPSLKVMTVMNEPCRLTCPHMSTIKSKRKQLKMFVSVNLYVHECSTI